MKRNIWFPALLTSASILASACQQRAARTAQPLRPPEALIETHVLSPNSSPQLKLVIEGAIEQVGNQLYESVATDLINTICNTNCDIVRRLR